MAKVATREAYGKALAQYGADERIIVLDADLSKSTKTDTFRQVYPERHFNMGIAEGNLMCVAAGLASTGKVVFASTFAIFASERACEQIKLHLLSQIECKGGGNPCRSYCWRRRSIPSVR